MLQSTCMVPALPPVSILTQPEGWVPSVHGRGAAVALLFQSSPNPKVGCHSHLTRRLQYAFLVSILTQPEGWVPLETTTDS